MDQYIASTILPASSYDGILVLIICYVWLYFSISIEAVTSLNVRVHNVTGSRDSVHRQIGALPHRPVFTYTSSRSVGRSVDMEMPP